MNCVQRLGEEENELKHTHHCFGSMSTLAQAEESVYGEQHAVQLQNFMTKPHLVH